METQSPQTLMLVGSRMDKEKAAQYAHRVIMDNICRLRLKPGMPLEEQRLAEELGVSRTPVREALLDLQRQKLVEIHPQRGTFVTLIDPEHIQQIRHFRLILETAAIELACGLPDGDKGLAMMEENLALQELASSKKDYMRLQELDAEYHRLLFVTVRMFFAYEQLRDVTPHFDRERLLSFSGEKPSVIVADHRNILRAVLAHREDEAKRCMAIHLDRVTSDQEQIRQRNPRYYLSPTERRKNR